MILSASYCSVSRVAQTLRGGSARSQTPPRGGCKLESTCPYQQVMDMTDVDPSFSRSCRSKIRPFRGTPKSEASLSFATACVARLRSTSTYIPFASSPYASSRWPSTHPPLARGPSTRLRTFSASSSSQSQLTLDRARRSQSRDPTSFLRPSLAGSLPSYW
jgi:hypothetical protein